MSASKILIVDDELSIRMMLTRMVAPLKHDVYTADDGVRALELLGRVPIDLVISDLMMPRMDGLTLLERIRGEGMDCAFIILTGFGDLPQALTARDRFNVSSFLVKPIHNMDQFLFDVEAALSRRTLERENRSLLSRLQESNARLEETVLERTGELRQTNRELARVSKFRADALKVLGHELRTPLAILSGYHDLAARGAEGEFGALVPAMGSSIERLQQIVERALRLLKADEATEFPLELEEVSTTNLCEAVADRIRPFIAERDIEIRVPPRCGEGWVNRWDREKMEEVVEELLINAVRASGDHSRIEIGRTGDDEWVELTVTDFGVGVPIEQRERIFQPFTTLNKAENHSSGLFEFGAEGVGIGLSTARMWVALHGGTITAQDNGSLPGTTIRVRMPRRVEEAGARKAAEREHPGDEHEDAAAVAGR